MELFKLFGTIMVDNDKANKSINSTSKEADGLGNKLLNSAKTVGKWAAALGTAAVAAGTAIYGVSKKAANTTDHIDKMSQKLGLSREKYQELDFIMSQSGGSVDGLKKQLKSLDTAIEKSSDSSSDSAKAFDKLGISMTDATGKMKSSDEIFYDTIKGLQGITDSQEKNRIASELLGSKYKELRDEMKEEVAINRDMNTASQEEDDDFLAFMPKQEEKKIEDTLIEPLSYETLDQDSEDVVNALREAKVTVGKERYNTRLDILNKIKQDSSYVPTHGAKEESVQEVQQEEPTKKMSLLERLAAMSRRRC